MLAFPISIRPGLPIYEQIVYAAKKALMQGTLRPGDRFPSVRELSRELGVNPNTVQRAVAELISEGRLEVHPGQGCSVSAGDAPLLAEALKRLGPRLESLVVEAHQLGLHEAQVQQAVAEAWRRLQKEES
jgi:GntR family transcriptional regulator